MGFLAGGYLPSSLHGKTYDGLVSVADWYPTMCRLAGVADCTDNKVFLGKMRPIDGHDVWARIIANLSTATTASTVPLPSTGALAAGAAPLSPYNHEWFPSTQGAIIYQERWKLITNAQSTFWYQPDCGSAGGLKSCCNSTCRDAISDQGTANKAGWPCRGGSGPSPSPPGPPPPPAPGPPCSEPGYSCRPSAYCGPEQSFYWEGDATLEQCAGMCTANETCHGFDYRGPDDHDGAAVQTVQPPAHVSDRKSQCRLHVDASQLAHSGAGYSAYWKNTSAAELALAAREATDSAHEMWLATGGASQAAAGCSVCTKESPCLFDLSNDEQERHNLASAQPALVKQMLAQLATYTAYFGTPMDPGVLAAKYDCPADLRPWYGNFSGPCCRPKSP